MSCLSLLLAFAPLPLPLPACSHATTYILQRHADAYIFNAAFVACYGTCAPVHYPRAAKSSAHEHARAFCAMRAAARASRFSSATASANRAAAPRANIYAQSSGAVSRASPYASCHVAKTCAFSVACDAMPACCGTFSCHQTSVPCPTASASHPRLLCFVPPRSRCRYTAEVIRAARLCSCSSC